MTGSAGNGQVTLSWTPPVSSGGSLILGYRVESKVGDGPWTLRVASTDSPTPTADVTGLANGTPYSFRVSAISSGGTGSPSDPSAPITPRTVPSAPTNVTGTAGNARVDLAWNAPTDDGGAAVVSYRVDAQAAGGS